MPKYYKTGHAIFRTQREMKYKDPCSKIIKSFKGQPQSIRGNAGTLWELGHARNPTLLTHKSCLRPEGPFSFLCLGWTLPSSAHNIGFGNSFLEENHYYYS